MGNTAICETNCSKFTILPDTTSEWHKDGLYYYRRGEATCDNCGHHMYILQSKGTITKIISKWKPSNKHKCKHSKLIPDEDKMTYHRIGGLENTSNGFSLMFLAPFWQPDVFLKTEAVCLYCGKNFTVRANCKTIIRNKERIHVPTSEWKDINAST